MRTLDFEGLDPIELLRQLERSRLFRFFPSTGPLRRELYPRHMEFFARGATRAERAIIAANRVGKSLCVCFEATCHMTGWYPQWWAGRRFDRPVVCWAAGEDSKAVRESLQRHFMGPSDAIGTGLIPGDKIIRSPARGGIPDAIDFVQVRHSSGGVSRLVLKAYEQGRESFQGAHVDVLILDEEPSAAIYGEALTRTVSTTPGEEGGVVMCAFTPLKGVSDVVLSFLPGGKMPESEVIRDAAWGTRKWAVQATWDDVPHLDAATREELAKSYLPHERGARTMGVPQLGSGAIYPIAESEIVCEPFAIPAYYRHVFALDVGWQRTAALWGAVDGENDIVYLYAEHYRSEAHPAVHAAAIKARGAWVPGTIDPAARGRSQADGETLLNQYRALGLNLSLANNAVEAGIYEVWSRLSSGRLKVFKTLQNFLAEFRIYRRDEKGKVVKSNDHLMDCARYLCLSGLGLAAMRPRPPSSQGLLVGDPHAIWARHQARQRAASDYHPFHEMWGNFDPPPQNSPWRR
jgi:phage terminase large subunit-like protein